MSDWQQWAHREFPDILDPHTSHLHPFDHTAPRPNFDHPRHLNEGQRVSSDRTRAICSQNEVKPFALLSSTRFGIMDMVTVDLVISVRPQPELERPWPNISLAQDAFRERAFESEVIRVSGLIRPLDFDRFFIVTGTGICSRDLIMICNVSPNPNPKPNLLTKSKQFVSIRNNHNQKPNPTLILTQH